MYIAHCTVARRKGPMGSVMRSWPFLGLMGRSIPASAATFPAQAPAASTMQSARNSPAEVLTPTARPPSVRIWVTSVSVRYTAPRRFAALANPKVIASGFTFPPVGDQRAP